MKRKWKETISSYLLVVVLPAALALLGGCSPNIIRIQNDENRLPPPAHAPLFGSNRRFPAPALALERYGSSLAAGEFTRLNVGANHAEEIAVGKPGLPGPHGEKNVGGVVIHRRDINGNDTGVIEWTPDEANLQIMADMRCGAALASGDFNGDDFDDLAMGCPGAGATSGLVVISYGPDHDSGFGFVSNIETPGVRHNLGTALAVADFNQDGFDDLVVGEPGEDLILGGSPGIVWIFWGNNPGAGDIDLGLNNRHRTRIDCPAEHGQEANMLFGWSLATGNFVSRLDPSHVTAEPDLAIGAPKIDYVTADGTTYTDVGKVYIFRPAGGEQFSMQTSFVPSNGWARYARQFGFSLAAGNFNNDSNNGGPKTDLAIGAPYSSIPERDGIDQTLQVPEGEPRTPGAGLVFLAGHAENSLGPTLRVISQDRMGISQKNDHFGWSFATGDFNRDLTDDLAIGSPNEQIRGFDVSQVAEAGAIYFRFGQLGAWNTGNGIPAVPVACSDYIDAVRSGLSTTKGDGFGTVLLAAYYTNDVDIDLIVGAPSTDVSVGDRVAKDAGAIWIGSNQATPEGMFNGLYSGDIDTDEGDSTVTLNVHDRDGAVCGTLQTTEVFHLDGWEVGPTCITVSTLDDGSGHMAMSRYDVVDEDQEPLGFLRINADKDQANNIVNLGIVFEHPDGSIERDVSASYVGPPTNDTCQ